MEIQIRVYGTSGRVRKVSETFALVGNGVISCIRFGDISLISRRDAIRDIFFRIRLRCTKTAEETEISGFGSRTFLVEASQCAIGKSTVKIAGRGMLFERQLKNTPHEYVIWVECAEELEASIARPQSLKRKSG